VKSSIFATSGGSLTLDPSTLGEPDLVAAIIRLRNIGAVRPRYANAICDLKLGPTGLSDQILDGTDFGIDLNYVTWTVTALLIKKEILAGHLL